MRSDVMTLEERRLRAVCKDLQVGLYISARDWQRKRPHIHLVRDDLTLGSFSTFEAALGWLQGEPA